MDKDKVIEVNDVEVVEEKKELQVKERVEVQREVLGFEKLMDMATMMAKSTIVPVTYQNRPENCFIALDMASRMGISPMVVMQNLYVIQGKPSWSGSAIASMIRSNKNYRNVELNYTGTPNTDSWGAYVTADRISDGKKIKGGTVTIATAKKEGWFQKSGSKWQTMPEQMLGYRAYAWFGRLYCPEVMMGLQTSDEVEDIVNSKSSAINPYEKEGDK